MTLHTSEAKKTPGSTEQERTFFCCFLICHICHFYESKSEGINQLQAFCRLPAGPRRCHCYQGFAIMMSTFDDLLRRSLTLLYHEETVHNNVASYNWAIMKNMYYRPQHSRSRFEDVSLVSSADVCGPTTVKIFNFRTVLVPPRKATTCRLAPISIFELCCRLGPTNHSNSDGHLRTVIPRKHPPRNSPQQPSGPKRTRRPFRGAVLGEDAHFLSHSGSRTGELETRDHRSSPPQRR